MTKQKSASAPPSAPKWQLVSWQKKDEQNARIPLEWRLKTTPSSNVTNYLDIPRQCGILTEKELEITEKYDATALADAIRTRKLKCVDVTTAFCKRAAVAHQLTNCLTEVFFSDALQRASELDAHLDVGKPPLGPLHGIPVSLKDMFNVSRYDSSIGLAALCFKPATSNAVLVDCLLAAGAVLYCKTNVPQTLMALDSHNNIFGRTLNPINTAVTAGGSTGGEGALLAMRGSVLGVGTDVGGSIRIPAMCNGTYGVKPSAERIPYAGLESGSLPGAAKIGIPASAGPLAHSVRDVDLFFRAVSDQKPWMLDADVTPSPWTSLASGSGRKLRIGIVRRDGVIEPHPPIARILDEVKSALQVAAVDVVEMDITPLFSQCQSLANALFGVEGANAIFDLLESASEPLSPWLSTRMKRKKPLPLEKLQQLHGKRDALRKQFLSIWRDAKGDIDAFVCPVAPHPVPPIDGYNGVSYTSSFVLLDYPAGTLPVRKFTKADMKGEIKTKPKGSWDKANRELWTKLNRSIYVGTPLSVQVVAPRLQERQLVEAMAVIDDALKNAAPTSAKL